MDKDSRPKRYFWRRGAAFVVDVLLAYAWALVILAAANAVTGSDVYYWRGIATRTACSEAAPSPLLAGINASLPVAAGWSRVVGLCEVSAVGKKTQHILAVNDWIRDANITKTGSFTIPVSAAGDEFDSSLRLDPTVLVAYVLMIAWAWAAGRSPGKRLLGLAVQPVTGTDQAGSRALRRELLRLGPLALLPLVEVVATLATWRLADTLPAYLRLMQFIMNNMFVLIALSTVLGLPIAIYYVIPLVRWRGQTFYDRLAGTMVVRG